MKRFIFRLERVFQLRTQVERQRARELARAMREEEERRDAVADAAKRLERCSEQHLATEGDVAPAGAMQNQQMATQAAARQIEAAEASHQAAVEDLEAETREFGAARKDRRVVERLRERRRDAWGVEQNRAEQSENDGWAANRRDSKEGNP